MKIIMLLKTTVLFSLLCLYSCSSVEIEQEQNIPGTINVFSQQDIDNHADAILNSTYINTLFFRTSEPLDLSAFQNIDSVRTIYFKSCQQVEAFSQLKFAHEVDLVDSDCRRFILPNLRVVKDVFRVWLNDDLELIAMPSMENIGHIGINTNPNLKSIINMPKLITVQGMHIQSDKLEDLSAFNQCVGNEEAYYSFHLEEYFDFDNTFNSLENVGKLEVFANWGANLDWLSSLQKCKEFKFTGLISPDQFCDIVPLIESDEEVTFFLQSWLNNTYTHYDATSIVEYCD